MADSPSPPAAPTVPGYAILRNAAVFVAVVVAMFLVRFFQGILTPLVVATFLLLLIDAVSRVMQARMPRAPEWVRGGIAGAVILIAFAAVGGLFVIEGPAFGHQVRGLAPRLDQILAGVMAWFGADPITFEQIFSGVDPSVILSRAFSTARSLVSYGVLVIIYFGFLLASRATFSRKIDRLYESEYRRVGARRVVKAVRNAVEQYVRLQTLKALMMALAAWGLMFAMGLHDAIFVAFLVFLAAYVPILGPIAGSLFPGILALAQFDDLAHPAILVGVLGSGVFLIDNVLMPKLQSDELNIDPLLVLISIGFWGAILGAPGILLSTPLTVTVMAIASEFESTRWLAVLISREGDPIHNATRP
ncbi:MAG TPA: AI-2E family transporter [Caulobacteraceae bacterium]|nr:AI-2E family transporter [Caulobacteraceae bacterium]